MPRAVKTHVVLALLLACTMPVSSYAFQAMDVPIRDESGMPVKCHEDISQFFAPYEVNSFMFKETTGDDPSSEINLSMKYYFKSQTSPDKNNANDTKDNNSGCPQNNRANLWGFNPFFSYTGKYDFYWLPVRETRPSAPVISRYQNPALHFRHVLHDNGFFKDGDWWEFAIEHISNGQSLTAKDNKALIQNAYQTNNNAVMDSISRVGAMAAITAEIKNSIGTNSDLVAKAYLYRYGQEADVYWGRFANRKVDFNDFQILKLQWRTRYYGFNITTLPWQFCAEMNIGRLGFSEDSWNFMLNTPAIIDSYEIPFAFTAHRGPLNNLSDYTRVQNTFAVGVTFAY